MWCTNWDLVTRTMCANTIILYLLYFIYLYTDYHLFKTSVASHSTIRPITCNHNLRTALNSRIPYATIRINRTFHFHVPHVTKPLQNMARSMHTLPMLLFNLGGEMLYVLDQRLKAQNILEDKANKGNHSQ